MKIKTFLVVAIMLLGISRSQAQHVRARINFPVSINIGAPGPRPYHDAIWIGPEWQWRGGQYVAVPGYWARPNRYGDRWIPGHWKNGRRGFIWVPGHWR